MVDGDRFNVQRSSYALSEGQRENLASKYPTTDNSKIATKRDLLAERIPRLSEDIMLFDQSNLLDEDQWEDGWIELVEDLETGFDAPDIENLEDPSYQLGFQIAASLEWLQSDVSGTDGRRSLLVGMLDALLEGYQVNSKNGLSEFNRTKSTLHKFIRQHERQLKVGATVVESTSQITKDKRIPESLRKRGIKETAGVSRMILARNDPDTLWDSSTLVDDLLENTYLKEFDTLSDCVQNDIEEFRNAEYGKREVSGILEKLLREDGSRRHRVSSSNVWQGHNSPGKRTIGRELRKVANTSQGQEPWLERPLVKQDSTGRSRTYRLTAYGQLILKVDEKHMERYREWLHWLAAEEDSAPKSDIPLEFQSEIDVEDDLQMALNAIEEIL
ncbi:hypothetical protein [Natrialba hulunbeirensis]|uniref:hypothetical protein n=1 Tax=Natrialba hulunbeirensis TaxID=123783 RepID=UPI000AF5094C|nr:hypothetical protein [Natrialba hulunbeirensis]